MHCGVSAAIVSSLCFTSDESLFHSIHPCTGVYRRTQCFKKYPVSLTNSTSPTQRNSCNLELYLMHNFEYWEFSLINPHIWFHWQGLQFLQFRWSAGEFTQKSDSISLHTSPQVSYHCDTIYTFTCWSLNTHLKVQ